jgi:hypothetical protein
MNLLVESAIVFFGTLLAAALVALAGPGSVELSVRDFRAARPLPLLGTEGENRAVPPRPSR